ncbi:hypothetical protein EIP91_012158 [Steccherinum ochraceum]|uniref:Glycosyltransferase family 8 protein n=1 Tax=Steccherinum ochraceum TaxID=92696 RepID=A0A4R0RV23_9APHY|nr:hypothetical protein EIP91_012158 [Steccherinum ochraceum]
MSAYTIVDREAYPDHSDPPESPWRTRVAFHKNRHAPSLKRIVSYSYLVLLAIPLLLVFRHLHGTASSELTTSEEVVIRPPVAPYHPVPPVSVDTEEDLEELQDEPLLIEPMVEPPHPLTFALIMFSMIRRVKSILMYTSAPVNFHIICDDAAQNYLEGRFALRVWQARIKREGAIATDHSAGVPGLMKLFIHEILPTTVKKAIFLDTDAMFISDPVLLWNQFDDFGPEAALSMPTHFDQIAPQWHNANRICSCVMLLDLEKLRKLRLMDSVYYREDPTGVPALAPAAFRALYGPPGESGHYEDVKLGDQGYWWAIVDHRRELLQHLHFDYEVSSCLVRMYGTSLGDDGADEERAKSGQWLLDNTEHEDDVILPKVLHFNCLDGTPRFFEWEGWSDPDNYLTQNWGPAVFYHVGVKWLWLNQGPKDVTTVTMETVRDVVFADEQFGRGLSS